MISPINAPLWSRFGVFGWLHRTATVRKRLLVRLEEHLGRYLILTFRIDYGPDDSDLRVSDDRVRQSEVGMVHQVERLETDLQVDPLTERKFAADAEIQVHKSGRA